MTDVKCYGYHEIIGFEEDDPHYFLIQSKFHPSFNGDLIVARFLQQPKLAANWATLDECSRWSLVCMMMCIYDMKYDTPAPFVFN